VYLGASTTFTMNGGIIYGSDGGAYANKAGSGEGVSLYGHEAKYGDGSYILWDDAGFYLHSYTDATITGHN
jgi:hypothetical protein